MIPLSGSDIPASSAELARAMESGLATLGVSPKQIGASGAWPNLDEIALDLSGVTIDRNQRWPSAGTSSVGSLKSAAFRLAAAPILFESAPLDVRVVAEGASFEIRQGASGDHSLVLTNAIRGDVSAELARAELERVLLQFASEAARSHGVEVKSVKVDLNSRGPRAASVRVEVGAKMFIASATVVVSGDIDLDESLTARLSNLRFEGSGMAGNIAGGFLRPMLARFEGAQFPLLKYAIGGMQLKDVRLEVGDILRLTAAFGS